MALLGSSVDPRLFVQDYSGFTRAADIQGQSMANLGRQIAGGIERYGEMKQERKKLEAGTKAAVTGIESAIKMGESLGIDVESSLTPYLDKINDPNVSPIEAAAYAQQASNSIANVLNLGMKANEMGVEKARYAQTEAARIAELQAEANKPTKLKSEKAIVGGLEVPTLMDDFGNYYDPPTKLKIIDLPGYAKGLPAERVLEQGGAFVAPAMPMGSTQAVDTGMVLPELQRNVPTLSKEAQATIDAATAGYIDGMPTVGLPIAQDQSQSVQAGLDVTPPAAPDDSKLTPRGTSIEKEKKAETQMTAAQVQGLAAQGFRVNARPLADGSFMVSGTDIGGQAGETIETTPEGGFRIVRGSGGGGKTANEPAIKLGEGQQLVPDPTSPTGTRVANIPGGKAEQQAQQEEAAKELTKARGLEQASVALDEIDRFIEYTGKMSKLPFASPARRLMATAGMEQQSEAESSLDTVKANLKFEALDALRKASPSGASGLGQVTQNEFSALADQWGTLRLVGDPEKIQERALSIKRKLLDTVHGNQAHRDAMLKKGVITPQQYNDIQSQYPNGKQVTSEDARIDRFRKVFSTQPTQ